MFKFINISQLPLYNQDTDQDIPSVVSEFKSQIAQCDANIFIPPEYNRTILGVWDNAINQGSRPWGSHSWRLIPADILGVSIGNISTAIVQQYLRNSLAFLNMRAMNPLKYFLKWDDNMVNKQKNSPPKLKSLCNIELIAIYNLLKKSNYDALISLLFLKYAIMDTINLVYLWWNYDN